MKDNACKICRREREKLLLKGDRCLTPKCAMVKRPYAPGQHGQNFKGKQSEYSRQLREKQKVKALYGVMETQLRNYYEASDTAEGKTTENLVTILEKRTDNVVFRAGFASSRRESRQIVSHGKVTLNGQRITIPSILVKEKDVLVVTPKKDTKIEKDHSPQWMDVDMNKKEIKINRLPLREEIELAANEALVVEFYSR